jgi:hypothetical protein
MLRPSRYSVRAVVSAVASGSSLPRVFGSDASGDRAGLCERHFAKAADGAPSSLTDHDVKGLGAARAHAELQGRANILIDDLSR